MIKGLHIDYRISVTALFLLFAFPAMGQTSGGVDFLDKVQEQPKKAENQPAEVGNKPDSAPTNPIENSNQSQNTQTDKSGNSAEKPATTVSEKPQTSEKVSKEIQKSREPVISSPATERMKKPVISDELKVEPEAERPLRLTKPVWVDEKEVILPNGLPGYVPDNSQEMADEKTSLEKENSSPSLFQKLFGQMKEEEKKKEKEQQKVDAEGGFWDTILKYKKPIIIVGFLVLFALYKIRSGGGRSGGSGRRSPITINKVRRE